MREFEAQIHDFLVNNPLTYSDDSVTKIVEFVNGMAISPKVSVEIADTTELEKSQRILRLNVIVADV